MVNINLIITIFLSFLLIFIGRLALIGKTQFLTKDMLAKFKKEKSIIDVRGLNLFSGMGCISIGLEILFLGTFAYLECNVQYRITSYMLCFTIIYFFAASQRYDVTNFNNKGKMKIGTKILIIAISLIILLTFMTIN